MATKKTTKAVAAKKTVAKKATAKKATAKKTVKKTTTKKATAKKEVGELTGTQLRILAYLKKVRKSVTRPQVCEAIDLRTEVFGNQTGYVNDEINQRKVHAHNLINRKLVRKSEAEVDGKKVVVYTITPAGKKKV